MGACSSIVDDHHHRRSHSRKAVRVHAMHEQNGNGADNGDGNQSLDDELDDPASSHSSGDDADQSDSENNVNSDDPSELQSAFGTVPSKRKKKKKHRRNKSKHMHKKAQRALEERMRTLHSEDIIEDHTADVVRSPIESPRDIAERADLASTVNNTVNVSAISLKQTFSSNTIVPITSGSGPIATTGEKVSGPAATVPLFPFEPESITVLVIDSDLEVICCVEDWLQRCRYSVIACEDGDEAIEVLISAGAKQVTDNDSSSSTSDQCDIDVIITDWNIQCNSQKLLDWLMDNPSLKHIPVMILCDDEMTAQGMDRILRRGAADITKKPLLHHPFLHSIQTIVTAKIEHAHTQWLKSKGDAYKQELARAKNSLYIPGSLSHPHSSQSSFSHSSVPGSILATPKRSLSSMMQTLVSASPHTPRGISIISSPFSPAASLLKDNGIESVQAIMIADDETLHSDVFSAISGMSLTLHSCHSWNESWSLMEDIDSNSETHVIIAHNTSEKELSSPHFQRDGGNFPFSMSALSSPTSRTMWRGSNRPSLIHNANTLIGTSTAGIGAGHDKKNSTTMPINSLLSPTNNSPHFISPRPSQSMLQRQSIMRTIQSLSSYFGVELFIIDVYQFDGSEESVEWVERMKSRPAQYQCPILLLVPHDHNTETLTYIQSLHPLNVTTIPTQPVSQALLKTKLTRLLENISLLRHQRLYAYRAQTYRMLVKKMREQRHGNGGRLGLNGGGTRDSVSYIGGQDANLMSLLSSPIAGNSFPHRYSVGNSAHSNTAITGVVSPRQHRFSSRAPLNLGVDASGMMVLPSRKASEIILQPFTQFPPPQHVMRMQHAHEARGSTSMIHPLQSYTSVSSNSDGESVHGTVAIAEGEEHATPSALMMAITPPAVDENSRTITSAGTGARTIDTAASPIVSPTNSPNLRTDNEAAVRSSVSLFDHPAANGADPSLAPTSPSRSPRSNSNHRASITLANSPTSASVTKTQANLIDLARLAL